LISIRFKSIENAAVRLNGAPVSVGQTVMVPEGAQQAALTILRQSPDQNPALAATISIEVVDACGTWSSLVGGGPGAF
jgi:hypothetical protein